MCLRSSRLTRPRSSASHRVFAWASVPERRLRITANGSRTRQASPVRRPLAAEPLGRRVRLLWIGGLSPVRGSALEATKPVRWGSGRSAPTDAEIGFQHTAAQDKVSFVTY